MKVLHIMNCGFQSGIARHIQCLMACMPSNVQTAAVINAEYDSTVIPEFNQLGLKLYFLHGKSGHDLRILGRFRKVMDDFQPDIIHVHDMPFLVLLELFTVYRSIPVLHTFHSATKDLPLAKQILLRLIARRVDYWLPVSLHTWNQFLEYCPNARGEVFYNPVRIDQLPRKEEKRADAPLVVGTVARNAEEKDWPSFHAVERLVKEKLPQVEFWNLGEEKFCANACEMIGQMDLFLMTSKHEELPTTLLEAFGMKTAACGFIPEGGVSEILELSAGPLRKAFIPDRSTTDLGSLVLHLLNDKQQRSAIAQDAETVLKNHFDAQKNCQTRLIEIYKQLIEPKTE